LRASEHRFAVAGMPVELEVDHGISLPDPPRNLQPFLSHESNPFPIRVTLDAFPYPLNQENCSFKTGRWLFGEFDNRLVSRVTPSGMDVSPIHVEIDAQQGWGTIYIDHNFYQQKRYPLSSPMFELIFTTLLARQGGFLAHASGILYDQQALLFMGSSGTGKTTSARLWEQHTSAAVLCDDRIALRRVGDAFWAFGTPWHGNHPVISPRGGRLDKIFFIKHAQENKAERMKPGYSSAMMYARSFPPLWDRIGLASWVEASVDLAQQIPCYDFGFIPDTSAVDYLQSL